MHTIRTIEVVGFRGQAKPIRLDLNRNANFIIGRNGTGKTTLINLINAAISNDTNILRKTSFKSITIRLQMEGSRKVPSINIVKDAPQGSQSIIYNIKDSAGDESQTFFALRQGYRRVRISTGQFATIRDDIATEESANPKALNRKLASLYKHTWLSLQRVNDEVDDEPEEFDEYSSDVDRRLSQVFTDLIRYFSRLDRQVAEKTIEFQKQWFLSFLASNVSGTHASLKKLNVELEKASLETIFDRFEMSPSIYKSLLDSHFKKVRELQKRSDQVFRGLGEISLLIDSIRLHTLVQKWEDLQQSQLLTYKPKTDFIKIASDMLFKKRVEVNRSNQTVIISDNEPQVPIPIPSLSSGEKQLLIFLSETLLQEGEPRIFLADEPELSLHVEWQEELVPNLLDINKNAQVIFATHSPDVVGRFQDSIIEMEKIAS